MDVFDEISKGMEHTLSKDQMNKSTKKGENLEVNEIKEKKWKNYKKHKNSDHFLTIKR